MGILGFWGLGFWDFGILEFGFLVQPLNAPDVKALAAP